VWATEMGGWRDWGLSALHPCIFYPQQERSGFIKAAGPIVRGMEMGWWRGKGPLDYIPPADSVLSKERPGFIKARPIVRGMEMGLVEG
jgi:hypothetical protein